VSDLLELRAAFDKGLVSDGGGSVRYLLIEAKAREPLDLSCYDGDSPCDMNMKAGAALNLVLVIDASGSMSGARIAEAKRAASQIVKGLGSRDYISVVSFAEDVMVHVDGRLCDSNGKRNVLSAIKDIEIRGSTNLCEGWLTGARCAGRIMERHGGLKSHVLVLSDGRANLGTTDPGVLAVHAQQLQIRGLTTSAIGIGEDYSTEQLYTMAVHGGGVVHHTPNSDELVAVVCGELEGLRRRAVENLELTISYPQEVTVELLSFLPCEFANKGKLMVNLGGISSQACRSLVLRVKVAEQYDEQRGLIKFGIVGHYRQSNGEEAELSTRPLQVSLRYADYDLSSTQAVNKTEALKIAEIWQSWLIWETCEMNRRRNYQKIDRFLGREERYMKRFCGSLAEAQPLLKEVKELRRQACIDWDEASRKEIQSSSYRRSYEISDMRTISPRQWQTYLPGSTGAP